MRYTIKKNLLIKKIAQNNKMNKKQMKKNKIMKMKEEINI